MSCRCCGFNHVNLIVCRQILAFVFEALINGIDIVRDQCLAAKDTTQSAVFLNHCGKKMSIPYREANGPGIVLVKADDRYSGQ